MSQAESWQVSAMPRETASRPAIFQPWAELLIERGSYSKANAFWCETVGL